jgi:hypothetical protein
VTDIKVVVVVVEVIVSEGWDRIIVVVDLDGKGVVTDSKVVVVNAEEDKEDFLDIEACEQSRVTVIVSRKVEVDRVGQIEANAFEIEEGR